MCYRLSQFNSVTNYNHNSLIMKCTIPEISWHNREPVLSVDIHPDFTTFYRLATGGGDCHILIWQIFIEGDGTVKQEVISDLKWHQKSVNVVRWSPSGLYLASADDDANIIIWQLKTDNIPSLDDTDDKETWNVSKILRGHKEDIYDLCWSPNGLKLLSGSIDNTAILWDFKSGKSEQIMMDHKGFVQGVAWDPKSQYIATVSTDRICRIYDSIGKHVKARISKGSIPVSKDHPLYEKDVKYFHDDTFKSFFRRLCFSPDGHLLIVPSGHIVADEGKPLNCTHIFTVEISSPIAILPLPKQCSVVVKCCPIYFELREDGPEPYINLPYRILFAVGTDHDVILYDTQQIAPFARFNNIHYTRLTDLTWSVDGLLLIAASTDGYCTLITFEPEELGIQYIKEESETEDSFSNVSTSEPIDVEIEDSKGKEISEKVIKIITPKKKLKKTTLPEKNSSILSFFKKTSNSGKLLNADDSIEIKKNNEDLLNNELFHNNDQALNEKNTPCDEKVSTQKLVGSDRSKNCGQSGSKECSSAQNVRSEKQSRRITPSRVS